VGQNMKKEAEEEEDRKIKEIDDVRKEEVE
jgi:hypothetical protein